MKRKNKEKHDQKMKNFASIFFFFYDYLTEDLDYTNAMVTNHKLVEMMSLQMIKI